MTDTISEAFDHPEVRAQALSGTDLRDRISLRDYLTEVDIGAFQAERGHSQRLRFNVVVEVLPASAPVADDVDRILSYDLVAESIEAALAEERLNLLETLAERVAALILRAPMAERVFVRIEKLDRGTGALGVEIMRDRSGPEVGEAAVPGPAPRVIFLSNAAMAAPDFCARLDAALDQGAPLILTCGMAKAEVPRSSSALAQWRIDLLAIEQNAWVLAGRDRRCVVVNTRTELDWGMKHGQTCVWAPSKLVLDAVHGPVRGASAQDLSLWLAGELGASELLCVGAQAPAAAGPLPIRSLPVEGWA